MSLFSMFGILCGCKRTFKEALSLSSNSTWQFIFHLFPEHSEQVDLLYLQATINCDTFIVFVYISDFHIWPENVKFQTINQ